MLWYFIVLSLYVPVCLAAKWSYLLEDIARSVNSSQKQTFLPRNRTDNLSSSKGFVTCCGNKFIPDLVRSLFLLRRVWRSRLGVTIIHCGEILPENIEMIRAIDEFDNIAISDICANHGSLLDMNIDFARKKLRGFHCKIAAAILSPYDQTLLFDNDLVWFKNPERLFSSPVYLQNGALFFRDRALHGTHYKDGQPISRTQAVLSLMKVAGTTLNSSFVQDQYRLNGISPWWRCLIPYWYDNQAYSPKCYGEFQDSSMVLINKRSHVQMLKWLQRLIFIGNEIGYGDKEYFWVAATLANEPFQFSPFIAGQYGDCSGFVMHYDPDDAFDPVKRGNPSMFYMNAEYLVEQTGGRLSSVGQFLQRRCMKGILMTANMSILPHNDCYIAPYKASNCTCRDYECQLVSDEVQEHLVLAQWVTLSLRITDRGRSPISLTEVEARDWPCVPVLLTVAPLLHRAFTRLLHNNDNNNNNLCWWIGCPHITSPEELKSGVMGNMSAWLPGEGRYCEPVKFNPTHDISAIAKAMRRPMSGINIPTALGEKIEKNRHQGVLVVCTPHRSMYMLGDDNLLHSFPNFRTFEKVSVLINKLFCVYLNSFFVFVS